MNAHFVIFFLVHWLVPTFMALSFDSAATIRRSSVFGLTSNILVNKHNDYLALGFFTDVDFINNLGLLSVTPSGLNAIAASMLSLRFCWSSHLTAC